MIASIGSTICGSLRSSTRTSPGPYITAPRTMLSFALKIWTVVGYPGSRGDLGVVPSEVGRERSVRVDLREQEAGLLLDTLDGVLAGDPAQRRIVVVAELDERSGELGRVASLLAVHRAPRWDRLRCALGLVVDQHLGERGGLGLQQLGAKKPGSTIDRADPKAYAFSRIPTGLVPPRTAHRSHARPRSQGCRTRRPPGSPGG